MAKDKRTPENAGIKSSPNAQAFTTKLIAEFKDRQRAEIQKWRRALAQATDPDAPRLYVLQDLYDNLKADGHLISQVELRKAATLCNGFSIIDRKSGKEQPEKTEFIKQQWFYDLMEDILECTMRGYDVLELTDTMWPRFTAIPRRNLIPSKRQILYSAQDDKGVDYSPFIGNTLIEVGSPDELGIMADLCGQLIWKRNAQQSWAEYSERFGFPLITATTNKSNDADIARIKSMLAALGEASQAVLPEGTTIDIKAANVGDAYNVYDKQIERINSEMGKPITGGTMISDNGSSKSQSEVHERNLDDKIAARDRRIITFTVNDQVIPLLSRWGHPLNPETDLFLFDQTYELSVKDHWQIVKDASGMFEIPQDWISKTFNIPITGVKQQALPPTVNKPPVAKLLNPDGFSANFQ